MTLLAAAIIDAVSTDADALRRTYKLLAGGQQGVINDTDLKVTAGSGMQSVTAAGDGLINGSSNSVTQGAYGIKNDASVTLTHSTADPTNPRNDLVGIKIEDAFYAGVNKQATLVIVTGTPAPSPADPATPANWLPLTRVRVNAGASTLGTITDLRPRIGLPYHAEVSLAGVQSITTGGSGTVIAYDTVDSDPSSSFTTGASAHYTAPLSGRYLVTGCLDFNWGAAAAVAAYISLYKNGAEYKRGSQAPISANANNPQLTISVVARCAAADTLDLRGFQNTGGTVGVFAGAAFTWAQFTYLGPL